MRLGRRSFADVYPGRRIGNDAELRVKEVTFKDDEARPRKLNLAAGKF